MKRLPAFFGGRDFLQQTVTSVRIKNKNRQEQIFMLKANIKFFFQISKSLTGHSE